MHSHKVIEGSYQERDQPYGKYQRNEAQENAFKKELPDQLFPVGAHHLSQAHLLGPAQ